VSDAAGPRGRKSARAAAGATESAAAREARARHTPIASPLDPRACLAAACVGLASGLMAVAFRTSLRFAEGSHERVAALLDGYGAPGWIALVGLAAAMGALARLLVARVAPETAGSGIPGVEARLGVDEPMRWRRILPVKFFGGLAALVTGMSLGREGPTVQMGAAIGEGVGEIGVKRTSVPSKLLRKALVAAGAGAGLTGAFDAPIAGFLFVIEELRWEISPLTYTTALVATLCAQIVIEALIGPDPLFGRHDSPTLPASGFLAAAVCGLVCGVAGVVYNRCVLTALDVYDRWRSVPVWAHGAIAAALAIVVGYWLPGATFGGDPIAGALSRGAIDDIVRAQTIGSPYGHLPPLAPAYVLALLVVGKLFLTSASYGCGVVGGLFAPQLVIGATLGALVALAAGVWMPGVPLAAPLAGAGAVAVFTASVRVPATGLVLIVEMTGAANQAFPWAVAAIVAFLVATGLRNQPIYEALLDRAAAGEPAPPLLPEPAPEASR